MAVLEGPVKRAYGAHNGTFTHAIRLQFQSRQGAGWHSAIICFVAGAIATTCFPSPIICFVAGAIANNCFLSEIIFFVVAGAIANDCFVWLALWLTADGIC